MKMRIKRRYQLEDALKEMGSIVEYGKNDFKFLPFWFEFDGQQIYAHHLDDLPEGFKKRLKEIREGMTIDMDDPDVKSKMFDDLFDYGQAKIKKKFDAVKMMRDIREKRHNEKNKK